VIGARKPHILWREILPNVMPTLVSFAFLTMGIMLVLEGSLVLPRPQRPGPPSPGAR
jgi:peptide/nickel transport system permease protein